MKTHRFTKLFLYCFGGERSVKCVRPALEMEARKEEQRGVVSSWWLRMLEHAKFIVACQNALECCRAELSFCMITPVPILPIWRGINFRDLAVKRFNILRTVQIFPLVAYISGDLEKDIPGRRFYSNEEVQETVRFWIHQRSTSFHMTGIDRLVSQWDKCI